MPSSAKELDLSPRPDKHYKNFSRPWSEDIIYFLLIDRFHDSFSRKPVNSGPDRATGFGREDQLHRFCGGTINGIRNNLSYIRSLGCTAIWISPFLHNNPEAYHGYAVQDFLQVDSRFGTRSDLASLVEEAHRQDLKVIFDVVINHSGNNWKYASEPRNYDQGKIFPFGGWRFESFPNPEELRNIRFYRRQGMIRNWDDYPETQEGDFFGLRKFRLDESVDGQLLQDVLFRIYAWWIKETDCDGFRLDTMKHIEPLQVARFCTRIREYAASLGKPDFFIFGEHPGSYQQVDEYFQERNVNGEVLQGPGSVLDFPLHYILPELLSGKAGKAALRKRYSNLNSSRRSAVNKRLVTFLDNHDQLAQLEKKRIAADLNDDQLIGGLGLLFSLPGIPCIYYGTEQGFSGKGNTDAFVRESMFNPDDVTGNHLNQNCHIYTEIHKLSLIRRENHALTSSEINFLPVSTGGKAIKTVLAYERGEGQEKCIVIYNQSSNQMKDVCVQVKNKYGYTFNLSFIYGERGSESISLEKKEKIIFFKINLLPFQFAILKLAPNLVLI